MSSVESYRNAEFPAPTKAAPRHAAGKTRFDINHTDKGAAGVFSQALCMAIREQRLVEMISRAPRRLPQPDSNPGPTTGVYPAVLAYGFRPFFLLAGLHAFVAIPLWIAALGGFDLLPPTLPARVWHAHELLYGFIAAAMAGRRFDQRR